MQFPVTKLRATGPEFSALISSDCDQRAGCPQFGDIVITTNRLHRALNTNRYYDHKQILSLAFSTCPARCTNSPSLLNRNVGLTP
ncbi:hypothetical protein RRG08_015588 [Elysia crispata]|uniref:Uncharacterized protein n=1 Tax=Elysia crispata TaxID=231223 RepID=A0AAE1CZH0_9GAST|nr:hypothetical protein RRG08_015588 [Elysia crispata]